MAIEASQCPAGGKRRLVGAWVACFTIKKAEENNQVDSQLDVFYNLRMYYFFGNLYFLRQIPVKLKKKMYGGHPSAILQCFRQRF